MQAICPKCSSESAWFEYTDRDVVLRCLCGFNRVIQTHLGELTIDHAEKPEEVALPRQGTKLWQCLIALHGMESANTGAITEQVNRDNGVKYDNDEVSSHMTVLRYKGLVEVSEYRKGFPGGSTWVLTAAASQLLQVD